MAQAPLKSTRTSRIFLRGIRVSCDLTFYQCPECPLQYPRGAVWEKSFKNHLLSSHLTFVSFRCFAVPAASSKFSDHSLHPDLRGTNLTDRLLNQYKKSAEQFRKEIVARSDDYTFSYLEATLKDSTKLYICSSCTFTSHSLSDYKNHVSLIHVVVEKSDAPRPNWPKCPVLHVIGPCHDLK